MTISDLMTSTKPDTDLLFKVLSKINGYNPHNCYQCLRCTSGCQSMRMLELKPHEIVNLVKLGFIGELIDSGIIWACAQCLKCKERCPQLVSPVDLILMLRNLAVEMEAKVPESFLRIVSAIIETGFIQKPQRIITRKLERMTRDSLGLPSFYEANDKFKMAFLKALERS